MISWSQYIPRKQTQFLSKGQGRVPSEQRKKGSHQHPLKGKVPQNEEDQESNNIISMVSHHNLIWDLNYVGSRGRGRGRGRGAHGHGGTGAGGSGGAGGNGGDDGKKPKPKGAETEEEDEEEEEQQEEEEKEEEEHDTEEVEAGEESETEEKGEPEKPKVVRSTRRTVIYQESSEEDVRN